MSYLSTRFIASNLAINSVLTLKITFTCVLNGKKVRYVIAIIMYNMCRCGRNAHCFASSLTRPETTNRSQLTASRRTIIIYWRVCIVKMIESENSLSIFFFIFRTYECSATYLILCNCNITFFGEKKSNIYYFIFFNLTLFDELNFDRTYCRIIFF